MFFTRLCFLGYVGLFQPGEEEYTGQLQCLKFYKNDKGPALKIPGLGIACGKHDVEDF